jgi:PAS domain S-box-containing protein
MGGMSGPAPHEGADDRERELDRAILAALFGESPVGLYVYDLDLRLMRYNTAAAEMRGVPSEELIGRTLRDIVPGFDAAAIERVLEEVRDTGEPALEQEVTGRNLGDPTAERVMSFSALRLHDPEGRPLGVVTSTVDVTDRARARARLDLIHAADARVGTTLDIARTARELAEVVVPELADSVAIDVLESVLRGEAPPAGAVDARLPLRRVALRAAHETREDEAGVYAVGEASAFAAPTPYGEALTDLRPRLISRLDQDSPWLAHDPARADLLRALGVHSLIVVPLAARGVVLGLACFYRWSDRGPFEEDDLTLAVELCARTALCLDNARRYVREHTIADILQRSLLPSRLPAVTAVDTAHGYLPGEAGGEWFDVIPLSGARVALVVGDIEGRGIHAAVAMGRLRTAIRTLAVLDLTPHETLAYLDDLVLELAREQARPADTSEPPPTSATCLYAVYDPVSRRCALARAGHPPPLLLRPGGDTDVLDVPAGPVLGRGGPPFEGVEVELPEGSVLALYTHGLLTGRPDGPDTALARLRRVLAPADRSLQDMCDTALTALGPTDLGDEAVLLLARTRVLQADRVASWTLPADPAIVATARALAERQLRTWHLPDLAFSAELVVSELVTNAIRHAEGPITLRLIHEHTLICEVSDHSSTAPRLRHARATDEGGRGLFLVAQTTQGWGTRYTAEGKTIWAQLQAPDPD